MLIDEAAAAFAEARHGLAAAIENSVQVCADGAPPILDREIGDAGEEAEAGVVDQNVEAAEPLVDGAEQSRDVAGMGDIGRAAGHLAAACGEFGDRPAHRISRSGRKWLPTLRPRAGLRRSPVRCRASRRSRGRTCLPGIVPYFDYSAVGARLRTGGEAGRRTHTKKKPATGIPDAGLGTTPEKEKETNRGASESDARPSRLSPSGPCRCRRRPRCPNRAPSATAAC